MVVECKSWSTAPNQLCFDTSEFVEHTLEFIHLQPQSQAGRVQKRKKVVRRDLFASLSLCWLSCNVLLDLECQNMNKGPPPLLYCVKYEFLKRKKHYLRSIVGLKDCSRFSTSTNFFSFFWRTSVGVIGFPKEGKVLIEPLIELL